MPLAVLHLRQCKFVITHNGAPLSLMKVIRHDTDDGQNYRLIVKIAQLCVA